MKQNTYDDPEFFARYSAMERSTGGLEQAGEWHAFRALLPDLSGKRVLDLGCGFGWHCRAARERGAASVLGIDLSEKMLERARAETSDAAISYRRAAVEDLDLETGSFDVVISSLAFHYIEDFDAVCRKVHDWLTPGGAFVFSVEHPVFTAVAAQDWHYGPDGDRQHWPVDDYLSEGPRQTAWLESGATKYHRTLATTLNALLAAAFGISGIAEPGPPAELVAARPDMADETRRPMFLIVAAKKRDPGPTPP